MMNNGIYYKYKIQFLVWCYKVFNCSTVATVALWQFWAKNFFWQRSVDRIGATIPLHRQR
jgi:hypothetical protein